jgi:glucose-6-phosphate-specific signal transduction histidine kinase
MMNAEYGYYYYWKTSMIAKLMESMALMTAFIEHGRV